MSAKKNRPDESGARPEDPGEGRVKPGYLAIPNQVIDSGLLAIMRGSELKTYAAILRHVNNRIIGDGPR